MTLLLEMMRNTRDHRVISKERIAVCNVVLNLRHARRTIAIERPRPVHIDAVVLVVEDQPWIERNNRPRPPESVALAKQIPYRHALAANAHAQRQPLHLRNPLRNA